MDSQDFGENSRGMDVECLEEDEEVVKMQPSESSGEGKKRKVVDILYDTLNDGNSDAENDGKLLDPNPEEDQNMFCLPATVYIRNFKGHKTGPSIGKVFVNCETAAEVMSTVWNYCESYVRREAIFEPVVGGDANKYTVHWHENETPDQGDMDKFITFQTKASKRTYKPTQLLDKPEKIQKFLKKDVNVFVHIYSESLTSANMYDILRTQLLKPKERDRAGAASNQTIRNLFDETDVSGSIAAAEDSFGRELAEDVVDAVDTDHL